MNFHLVLALAKNGKLKDSAPHIQHTLEMSQDVDEKVRRLTNIAMALRDRKEYKNALRWLEAAVALKPADAIVRNDIGAVLYELHYLDAALVAFRQAVQLKPDYKEAVANVELVLEKQSELDQQIPKLSEELSRHPDDLAVLNRLGVAVAMRGRFSEALRYFDKAVAIDPTFETTRRNIADNRRAKTRPSDKVGTVGSASGRAYLLSKVIHISFGIRASQCRDQDSGKRRISGLICPKFGLKRTGSHPWNESLSR